MKIIVKNFVFLNIFLALTIQSKPNEKTLLLERRPILPSHPSLHEIDLRCHSKPSSNQYFDSSDSDSEHYFNHHPLNTEKNRETCGFWALLNCFKRNDS